MFIAVDKNGEEGLYTYLPQRGNKMWLRNSKDFVKTGADWFPMEIGTIEKVIGIKITWEHEPIEIDVSRWLDILEEHPLTYN